MVVAIRSPFFNLTFVSAAAKEDLQKPEQPAEIRRMGPGLTWKQGYEDADVFKVDLKMDISLPKAA